MQLRHVLKVHAVPARDERQREKDGGEHRQKLHVFVLARIHLRLIGVAHLLRIVEQMHGAAHQPVSAVGDRAEILELLFGEEMVFVFLKRLAQVHHLVIIHAQREQLAAKRQDFLVNTVNLAVQNCFLHLHQPPLIAVQHRHIHGYALREEIVQKQLARRALMRALAANAPDDAHGKLIVIENDNVLLIDKKQNAVPAAQNVQQAWNIQRAVQAFLLGFQLAQVNLRAHNVAVIHHVRQLHGRLRLTEIGDDDEGILRSARVRLNLPQHFSQRKQLHFFAAAFCSRS